MQSIIIIIKWSWPRDRLSLWTTCSIYAPVSVQWFVEKAWCSCRSFPLIWCETCFGNVTACCSLTAALSYCWRKSSMSCCFCITLKKLQVTNQSSHRELKKPAGDRHLTVTSTPPSHHQGEQVYLAVQANAVEEYTVHLLLTTPNFCIAQLD